MAGSQLKQLKEALKKQGLTGQTNTKSKKNIKKAPSDSRRDDKREVLEKIREQFNPFEIKVNKKKTDIDERSQKGLTGRPGISKQIGEDARMAAYEAKKSLKNRTGIFKDRRFGENDKNMTEEEKMLHRFAKERQAQSSKKSMFSLNDDSDDEENEVGLTHFGKAISLKDDFEQEDDLKNGSDDDDDFLKPKKRSRDDDEEAEEGALEFQHEEPNRKKTKAEVMKEVMAKSKFYKQQRQILREKTEEKIFDLDEEYDDVLAELGSVPKPAAAKAPQFAKVDANGMSYEKSLKELNMERRAVPADRTKTEEEVRKERADKMRELEEARLRRMEGMEDSREKGPDELDDDFWAGSDSEGYVLGQNHIDGEDDEEEEEAGDEDDEVDEHGVPKKFKQNAEIQCPESHDDFLDILESYKFEETITAASKILTTYAPRLAVGNKEKLGIFTVILFQHILYLSESELIEEEKFAEIQEGLVSLVKTLSQKYNFELTQSLRDKIEEIHERITDTLQGQDEFPRISDLTFFALVGVLYSTSDHYHLIVTPTCIVLGEALEQVKYETLNSLVAGIFIAETFLKYQRISKRFAPEVVYFLQKALLSFIDEELESDLITGKADAKFDLPKTLTYNEDSFIKISDLELDNLDTEASKSSIFHKLINVIELALDTWKDKSSLLEISAPFVTILAHFQTKYPDFKPLSQLSLKFTRLLKFAQDERVPLTLQAHKKLSIATFTPKFEENFNPERKSYDENRSRVELSKMNKQIKQERKIALKELRKDSKFEARQQIKEKKEKYAEYHSKMKRIMNTINTVEGAERNEYDREKKLRKSKK
ncbi:hypothetical protein WICPIJ_005362 [Wickerhamomyces pijperi]|uniref:Nucleolar complex protein 14 n=1 Tax=Wickerhamomyces pijperi TaxID=599730 RepID=A0A9P8Q438_WICPI|nr:hypothetical protein WICPIJ_005362 [Wickerhamomyces pijperi]